MAAPRAVALREQEEVKASEIVADVEAEEAGSGCDEFCGAACDAAEPQDAPPRDWVAAARHGGTQLLDRARSLPRRTKAAIAAAALVSLALIIGLSAGLTVRRSVEDVARFTLVIRREVLAGSTKPQVSVNGAVPGPTLKVALGQRVEVLVVNEISDDATAVHWHGMFQRGSGWADGVIGVTQCPIPNTPGSNSLLYTFTPERAGTFWYHGHYHEQYPDGLFGAVVVTGPDDDAAAAAGHADGAAPVADLIFMAHDWYNVPVSSLMPAYLSPASGGDEPMPDAFRVNNLVSGGAFSIAAARNGGPVRLRLINAAAFSMYSFSVDGLPLTLVELDGTAVEPMDLPYIVLNVAQRASVILDFSRMHPDVADSPALWLRMDAMPEMYPTFNASAPDLGLRGTAGGQPLDTHWTGLLRFTGEGGAAAMPSYSAPPALRLAPPAETNLLAARPVPAERAPDATQSMYLEIVFDADASGVNRAYINGATHPGPSPVAMAVPLLHTYMTSQGGPLTVPETLTGTLEGTATKPFLLPYGRVIEVLINNTDGGEHPFHLHGHTLWVVATSEAPEAKALYAANYVRRDVVSVPAGGWAIVRFVADNPGIWLMHCHIDFHMAAGLVATFIEAPAMMRVAAITGDMRVPADHAALCRNYAATVV